MISSWLGRGTPSPSKALVHISLASHIELKLYPPDVEKQNHHITATAEALSDTRAHPTKHIYRSKPTTSEALFLETAAAVKLVSWRKHANVCYHHDWIPIK